MQEGRRVARSPHFADAIATLGACWVFPKVDRVTTCPDLVGPVEFEPTTKGLRGAPKVSEPVVKVSEYVSLLQLSEVFLQWW